MKSHFTNYDHPFFHISKEDRIKNGRKGANVSGNRPYSKDEDDYLIKNYQKIPFTEMAKIFGRSSHSVYTRSKKLIRDGLIANNGSWRKLRISVIAIARFGLFRSPDPAVFLSSYFYSK
ncbi:hypothetical protein VCSRO86_3238 [Vibrio cholerae]|nr:hypothetical protein VCSRO86_3238 [Vibrio cholerae]